MPLVKQQIMSMLSSFPAVWCKLTFVISLLGSASDSLTCKNFKVRKEIIFFLLHKPENQNDFPQSVVEVLQVMQSLSSIWPFAACYEKVTNSSGQGQMEIAKTVNKSPYSVQQS